MGGFAEAGSWIRRGEVAKEETLLRSDRQLRMSAEEKDVEMRGFKPCCTSAVACSTSGALQCGCIYPEAGAATPDAYALLEHLLMCPAQTTHARRLSRRASVRVSGSPSPHRHALAPLCFLLLWALSLAAWHRHPCASVRGRGPSPPGDSMAVALA